MSELMNISGRFLLDKKILIQVLGNLTPIPLDENSTQYHIGYERAKADILSTFARALGPELGVDHATRLIRELRNG